MTIDLRIGGLSHMGWKSARITRSLQRAAADFELTVSEKWPGEGTAPTIRTGALCEVYMDGRRMVTGYVDDVSPRYSATEHVVTFRGRSKTADLVDSSVITTPTQWKGARMQTIVDALVAPFGLTVVYSAGAGEVFNDFTIQQSETVFAAIERMCRMRGLLVSDNEAGNLVITRVGSARSQGAIRNRRGDERNNVLSGEGHFSDRDRFSEYIVKGQSAGTDEWFGASAAQVKARVTDTNVARHRPMLVIAESQVDPDKARDRAKWERATRAGMAVGMAFTVQGWTQAPGAGHWRVNERVSVADDFLHVGGEYLIAETTFEIGDSGSITKLRVGPPDAFEPFEVARIKSDTGYWVTPQPANAAVGAGDE